MVSRGVDCSSENFRTVSSKSANLSSVDGKNCFCFASFEPGIITKNKLKAKSESENSEAVYVATKLAFLETDSLSGS